MFELPDPGLVTRCAELARGHAEVVRAGAARLATAAATSEWAGPAARAFRAQTQELVDHLNAAARHLDDAAARLDRDAATLGIEVAEQERHRAAELARIRAALTAIEEHR